MPAYGNFLLDKGYDADVVLTKYRGVKAGTGVESVTAITTAGEYGEGISQFDVTTADLTRGKGASVRKQGISEWEVKAGQTFARDAEVTVHSDGTCKAAATGDTVWGRAMQAVAASAAGVRIAVEISPAKYVKP